jgi:hypothetical protein
MVSGVVLVLMVLSALVPVALAVSQEYSPGIYILRAQVTGGRETAVNITVLTPLSPPAETPVYGYSFGSSYAIMKDTGVEGEPISVAGYVSESYTCTAAYEEPSIVLRAFRDLYEGYVESKIFWSSGEVERYVRLEVASVATDLSRLEGYSTIFRFSATFYGKEFEGLSVSEVRKRLGELLEPEISIVVPFYTSAPELVPGGTYLGNRTLEVERVEYSNGRFYAEFRVVDTNQILPVVANFTLTVENVYTPDQTGNYTCRFKMEEYYTILAFEPTLREIDRLYARWVEAVKAALSNMEYGADEYREKVMPVEQDLELLLLDAMLMSPSNVPRDPFLWLALLDFARYHPGIPIRVTASMHVDVLEPVPPKHLGNITWHIRNYMRVPVTILFNVPTDAYDPVLLEVSWLLYSVASGYRFDYVASNPEIVRFGETLRYYAYTPFVEEIVDPEDLYNATLTLPLYSPKVTDYCKTVEEAYSGAKVEGDTCTIIESYSLAGVAGDILEMLVGPLTTTTTPVMPTNGATTTETQIPLTTTSTTIQQHAETVTPTIPQPTTTSTSRAPHSQPPTEKTTGTILSQDILYSATIVAIIVLAAIAILIVVGRRE